MPIQLSPESAWSLAALLAVSAAATSACAAWFALGSVAAWQLPGQPSEYRLTIYRYAIIVSFSKYR